MSSKIRLQCWGCGDEQDDAICLFSDFVTFTKSDGYKEACKRASFALQKGTFYNAKGALLEGERWSFKNQRGVYFTK